MLVAVQGLQSSNSEMSANVCLIGVDLSATIIKEAEKARPGLYDTLREDNIMDVLSEIKPLSLIIAGDSYIYFGDLHPIFQAMEEGLDDGGYVAFTLENVAKETEKNLGRCRLFH